jgi:hypothetical protein
MLPNLHSLRYFYSIPLPFGPHSEDGITLVVGKTQLARSEESVHLDAWGTQSYYAVRSRVPRVSTYACAVCMHCAPHQPRANLHLLSRNPSWIQDPDKNRNVKFIFFPQFNDDAAWQVSTSLSPTPHVRTVDNDRRRPKWAHSDLASSTDPQTALSTPWIFFPLPARSPFEAYQQVCARLSKHADNALIHAPRSPPIKFLHPSVKFPFTPSPVGSAPHSTADSFNSDNYDQ